MADKYIILVNYISIHLKIVTRNLIFNRQKKTFNENFYKLSVLSAYEQSNIDSYNIEEELQAKELNNYIDKIIEELPPKQQEIFILSRKENLSHKEIAELLNISERRKGGYHTLL